VSKRTRGSSRSQHRRPGARPATARTSAPRQRADAASRPTTSTASATSTAPPPASDTPAPAAEAILDERPGTLRSTGTRAAHPRHRVKAGSLLATRAETEYVYVVQDLKRITVVGVLLFGALLALWLLIVVVRVIPLPFY
jgi:hypothetical protein